jgi:hypothetical protein
MDFPRGSDDVQARPIMSLPNQAGPVTLVVKFGSFALWVIPGSQPSRGSFEIREHALSPNWGALGRLLWLYTPPRADAHGMLAMPAYGGFHSPD